LFSFSSSFAFSSSFSFSFSFSFAFSSSFLFSFSFSFSSSLSSFALSSFALSSFASSSLPLSSPYSISSSSPVSLLSVLLSLDLCSILRMRADRTRVGAAAIVAVAARSLLGGATEMPLLSRRRSVLQYVD
jgi:hypothetical protein